ncbi:MAG: hypothetical protein HKN44_13895 [Ilumatobacter sp.]|nr:hypothetical protein [Ilumatobacter sp.]
MDDLPVEEFDPSAATRYMPNPDFVKTAVLVDVAEPGAVTVLRTSFGEQRMRGPFYAVADGAGSYGAAQENFEGTHRRDGPNTWVKQDPVLAYRSAKRCMVETHIGDHRESCVVAEPGDWVVKQRDGELMVVGPDAFAERYVPADEGAR